jgi:hypothetical protein
LVSKEQLKHVAVVIQGSNMARRPTPLISFVNTRIGSQENVDDIFRSFRRSELRGRALADDSDAASAR